MVSQKEVSKYIKRAGKGCPRPFRRKLSEELQNNISDFLDKDSGRTMEDVLSHFGSPEKFVDEYILAIDIENRQKMLRKAGQARRAVCVGISVIILIIAAAAFMIVRENSRTAGCYYTDTIIEYHDIKQ